MLPRLYLAKLRAFFLILVLFAEHFAAGKALAADGLAVSSSSFPASLVAFEGNVVTTTVAKSATTPERQLISEPTIRVGLYKTNQAVLFQSDFPYEILAGRESQGVLEAAERGKLDYSAGVYYFRGGGIELATTTYLRLVPGDWRENYFTLSSYSRPVGGRGPTNFNVYRGALEYRYSPRSDLPYIINELPLESYVAGIAESSNHVPEEYAKALLTAGRTYAYRQIKASPPGRNLFDVYPNTKDQIYLGYNSEQMMPNIAAAAKASTGEMITYQGEPVITPYFGNSSGRTKAWPGKGANARPWLKSVAAKYDKGRRLWGHGYGMSTRDAELRAKQDGWSYVEILKYYYTGTEVEKVY